MSWTDLLTHWDLIEADLQQVYGIDVEDLALMSARSWRWLRVRIEALLAVPPTLLVVGEDVLTIHQTRLGWALEPPRQE